MKTLILVLAMSILWLGCNNKGEVAFGDKASELGAGIALLTINKGAAFTNNRATKVQVNSPLTNEMIITADPKCESKDGYTAQVPEFNYTLPTTNAKTKLYGKFRNKYKAETPCVEASIIHDDIPPSIAWESKPVGEISGASALLKSTSEDNSSGVANHECSWDGTNYFACEKSFEVRGMTSKTYKLQVRAVDRAGNRSETVSADWLVDATPPTIEITKTPPPLGTNSDITFEFFGKDDGGSGVASYLCQLDSRRSGACTSPFRFSEVAEGAHLFSVWSVDRVGNSSNAATYSFEIDNIPSGSFSVLGVTTASPAFADYIIDSWLVSTSPRVHYTESAGATDYHTAILSVLGETICASTVGTSTSTSFGNSCRLQNNTTYLAEVTTGDRIGNRRTESFTFYTDMTSPNINIAGPFSSTDNLTARFEFSINDLAPGQLSSATCFHSYKEGSLPKQTQQSCTSLDALTFTNLNYGDHEFRIVATDMAGNSSEEHITWRVLRTICDPFSDDNTTCSGGLIGDLYYLNESMQKEFQKIWPGGVDYFFDHGIKIDAELNFLKLFGPSRAFSQGFPTSDGNIIKDDTGNKLQEYFAFKLKSVLKLDPSIDEPGLYEFATLSDDGSIFKIFKGGRWVEIVSNDYEHPTRLQCPNEAVAFDADTRLEIELDYFQGPKYFVALTLMWRRLDSSSTPEPLCGEFGEEFFFGPDLDDFSSTYGWGQLIERGWRPLSETNFISPKK